MAKKKNKTQRKISRSQRLMVIIGGLIIVAMLLPSLIYFFR